MFKKIIAISIFVMLLFSSGFSMAKEPSINPPEQESHERVYKPFKEEIKKLPEHIRKDVRLMLYNIIVYINKNDFPQTPYEGNLYASDVVVIMRNYYDKIGIIDSVVSVDYPGPNQNLYIDMAIRNTSENYIIFSVRFNLHYYKNINIPDSIV